MHTISTILLALVITLGLVGINTTNAQTFDITTSQEGQGEAVITVQLATNNTVVIPPNGTIIEVPGNITQVDNDTVVITPDNETVTPLPGNVTVITPPEPEPCGCPPANATGEGPLAPVVVRPAPGQEVVAANGTELVVEQNQTQDAPIVFPEPAPPVPDTGGNETGTGGNETGGTEGGNGNDTGLAPASFQQDIPWWQA